MISAELFWTRVGAYNEAVWPVTAAMTIAAAFLTYRVFWKPGSRTDLWMKAFLIDESVKHWTNHVQAIVSKE